MSMPALVNQQWHHLYADTKCSLEDLLRAMDDERVRELHAVNVTWLMM